MSIADKLTTIAENQQAVYDAGYAQGQSQGGGGGGYDQGFEAGKQSQYNTFWDMFQQNGTRTNYRYAFYNTPWDDANFNPKYPLKIVGNAEYAFVGTTFVWADKVLEVDLSQAASLFWSFRNNQFTRLGKCDLSSATNVNGTFSILPNLVEIEEIVSRADLPWDGTFYMCQNLESITFSGVIGSNGLNFANSTRLNKASIASIINALSTTTSGLSITLSKTAVTNAFGSTTATEWTTLIGTKSNWTISLV